MKTFVIIFFILVISIIVTLKLVTSTGPTTSYEISNSEYYRYDTGKERYQGGNGSSYQQRIDTEITEDKLKDFAKAFVNVQSYMNRAGNRANYEETSKIVQRHGLSVKEYTKIAKRMNADSDFQNKVLKLINDVN